MVQYRITKNRGSGKFRLEFKSGNDYLVCTDYELMKAEFVRDTLEECQLEMYKREKEDNNSVWDVVEDIRKREPKYIAEYDEFGNGRAVLVENKHDSTKYDSKGNLRPKTVEYPKGVR